MVTKTQLINTIGNLPENLSIDQVLEHLLFLEKVQKGLYDSENGKINSKEEARIKLNKWLK
jgi:hypothetical protein